MMNIAIVDTRFGNIRSVERALGEAGKRAGVDARVTVSADPDVIRNANALVFPGQGAFRDCAAALATHGLSEAIRESITRGVPYFGICLGLQALFATSEESPGSIGLGIFPGKVVRLDSRGLKLPHVGWNSADPARATWLLDEPDEFYFVHTFAAAPDDPSLACTTTEHGARFVSAIEKDNVVAVQFHPEKSQRAGLQMLERFLKRC
jgi:imidazole glycerol-phosphate synthase subunit HisH